MAPLLAVEKLEKVYTRGTLVKTPTFRLEADFTVPGPSIIGVMGPNGSGKTTLFELITGSNQPTRGEVRVRGQAIHRVRYRERSRLAIHYHQSYQVRRFRRRMPSFLLERARAEIPSVHLFDEPQFNTQDGYIGFMLDFFRRLRGEGRLVVVCLHPTARWQLDILEEICERYVFVEKGRLTHAGDLAALRENEAFRRYIGTAERPS
jgi:ABC-type multidrug transport system ATPase subunit